MARRDPREYLKTEHLRGDLGSRAAKGGALVATSQILKGLIEIGATMALARLLTPEDFGLLGMVVAVTGFIAMFKDLGLSMATIQRKEITHEQVTALFWVNLGLSTGLVAVTAALAPIIAWFYGDPRLIWITIGLASAFLFGGLTVQHEAILRRNMEFSSVAAVQISSMTFSVVCAVLVAVLGWEYWALVVKEVVSVAVSAAGVWIACGWRPGRPASAQGLKSLLRFGGNLTGFNIINYFARNLDDVLIGKLFGARSLGFYQEAYKILMVPLRQINNPIASVAIPALSRMTDEPERYRRAYLRILEKILLLTMPLGAFLIASSDWVILTILGDQWIEASPIFMALGVSILSQPIGNSAGWLFITQDRTREMLRWGFIGSATAVVSFLIGLPWGALGVAAAYSLVGIFVRTPLLVWFVTRRGPIRMLDFYRLATPFALGAAAVFGVVWYFRHSRWVFESHFANLGVAVALTIVTMTLTLAALPGGRRALADLLNMVAMLRKKPTGSDETDSK